MERNEYESVGLFRLELADELARRQAVERLQSAGEVVCADEVCETRSQFGMGLVEIATRGL